MTACLFSPDKSVEDSSVYTKSSDSDYVSVFLDVDFSDSISLETQEGIIFLQNTTDSLGEFDGVQLQLLEKVGEMYKVKAWHTLELDPIGEGLIRRTSPIAIFSRQYDPATHPLRLYSFPDSTSSFQIDTVYNTGPLKVIDFTSDKWLKVRYTRGERVIEGWISHDQQCASVYSTCN